MVILVLPVLVFAEDGLVPCSGADCDLCSFVVLVKKVQDFLLSYLILPASTLGLIIAGILILTGGSNSSRLEKGKSIFRHIIIGMLIAFSAWLIIDTILGNLLRDGYLPWNEFPEGQCSLF